jgi:elongator complex protein 4
MLTIHSLPAPHSLLPPSDKFSTLRAIHASGGTINSNAVSSASPSVASSAEGGGENNLAFKCMRKRLVFETLHLDVEGGVGERRTTPAKNASVLEDVATTLQHQQHQQHQHHLQQMKPAVESKVDVELEGVTSSMTPGPEKPVKKKKKAVVFQSDRPELYDF